MGGGIIDNDYRGEIMVILQNNTNELFDIAASDALLLINKKARKCHRYMG